MNNNTITIPSQHHNTVTIPSGWSSLPINEVFEFIGTSSFSRNDLNYEVEEDSIYYIHYGDIHATYKNAVLDFDTEARIPVLNKDIKPSAHLLKEGDLIIADASEDYEGIGEALEVYNLGNKKVLAGLHTFALRDNSGKTTHGYRAYIFKNHEVKNRLKTIATGSKVYGISKGNLTKFKITLPPYREQKKIAQILSTWDKAIVLQQQLIIQKQQYKKAVMKKLLTGKIRLKGFEKSQWRLKKLGQIGTFLKGKGITKAEIVEIGKPCIRYGQIYSEYNYFVEEFKSFINDASAKNSNPIFKNDLLFAGSGETLEDIGKCIAYIKSDEAYAGGDIIILRPHSEDAHYLGYLLNSVEVKKQTFKLGQGHSVVHIYSSSLKNLKITLPTPPEQQKIVEILATWDKEIKTLQQQLIVIQEQKQGLMQQLLTGKLRVKI
ncbi:restriction endonuclease subunit S [Flavobacterium sp. ZS1P14]|uniref:restriction endonuclease subunit S n=1 Tax=Flavobacterium sp. ZS1P14 TaxID=3401729 RepID=UPI003AB0916B